jgi:hypothetical protein
MKNLAHKDYEVIAAVTVRGGMSRAGQEGRLNMPV